MRDIAGFIREIKASYGLPSDHSSKYGECELCGYDTWKGRTHSKLYALPKSGDTIWACSYCVKKATKVWGESLNSKISGMLVKDEDLLDEMDDEDMAKFLVDRLNKRLTGYGSQKQMVPS